jgi:hypothetical protein
MKMTYGEPDSATPEARQWPTPAAALYGFAAWLTCRDEAVTFGAKHDAAPAAVLVDQFCKAQGFPELDDGWVDTLKPYPSASS